MKFEFVAVDFDGTLCENRFPEIGAPKVLVIAHVKWLAAQGSKIILHTCRENGTRPLLDEAVDFCKAQEIPLFAVNENPGNPYPALYGTSPQGGRKVYADLYIDDMAISVKEIERAAGLAYLLKKKGLDETWRRLHQDPFSLIAGQARNGAD